MRRIRREDRPLICGRHPAGNGRIGGERKGMDGNGRERTGEAESDRRGSEWTGADGIGLDRPQWIG